MLLEHDVANFKDDAGLRAFVSSVQQAATLFHRAALPRAPPSIPASVTLTVTNFAYASGFDNWLTFTRAALTLPVVAAMDRASYDYFVSRGECALLLRDSAKLPFNRRSLYIKSELSARLLGAQLKLIFSEMDVFWSEDPHLIEDRTLDIQPSEEGYGHRTLNFGFYIAQPTPRARAVFRRLSLWAQLNESGSQYAEGRSCFDQALYDYAVRGDPSSPLVRIPRYALCGHGMMHRAKHIVRDGPFMHGQVLPPGSDHAAGHAVGPPLWTPINYELLPHPFKWSGGKPQQLPRETIALGGVIGVHLWSTISPLPPPLRIECARMMGFWALPNSPLRVAPFLSSDDASLPNERVHMRTTIADLLSKLRDARASSLVSWGFGGATLPPGAPKLRTTGAAAAGEVWVPPAARFARVQAHGVGRWPNGEPIVDKLHLPVGSAGLLNTSASGGKCAAGMFTFGKPGSGDATVVDGTRPPPTELLNMFNRSSPPPPPPFVCCPGERSREADGTQIDTLHVHSAGLKKVNGRYRRVSTGTHPTFENDRGCSIKYATLGSGGCTMVAYSGWGIACDHHHRYATSGCADDLPTTCSWRPRRGHANPPAPCVCRADQEVTAVGKGMRVG